MSVCISFECPRYFYCKKAVAYSDCSDTVDWANCGGGCSDTSMNKVAEYTECGPRGNYAKFEEIGSLTTTNTNSFITDLSPQTLFINCKKIILANAGISIEIDNELPKEIKFIEVNGRKFKEVEK